MFARLAEKIPGFEDRPGQTAMAEAVESALRSGQHLAVEAPCGIGKTYAYLAPAIRYAVEEKAHVVVCTANIALQEQIFEKDLPALASTLDLPFRFALIKGIGNYLCLDRYHQTREEGARARFDKRESRQWKRLAEWAERTGSGDVSDLPFEPLPGVWNRVNGVSDLCTGRACRYFDDCHAMARRKDLRRAEIIVTNYHLFLAHLRLKAIAEQDLILPSYSAVVCDEAHELADITRDFFGLRLGPRSLAPLLRGAGYHRLGHLADRMRAAAQTFFADVESFARGGRYRNRLREPGFADGGPLLAAVSQYASTMEDLEKETEDEEALDSIRKLGRAARQVAQSVESFQKLDDPNMVYWIESGGRLASRLIDPSEILRTHLFEESTAVLTSATLAPFDFLRKETGTIPRELAVASPFDFRTQGILVVPRMRTRPNQAGYVEELSEGINRILRALGGRTMCLFTSYRNLEACAAAAAETGVEVLRQGDRPRTKLLRRFREKDGTALFATASFWQGVDIPGEALSCLVIDKLPFLPPDDPLVDALQERDPHCFQNYSLPKAILALRQGVGRLIRTRTDRGAVVLFDTRVVSSSYGPGFLEALPPFPLRRDIDATSLFLKEK